MREGRRKDRQTDIQKGKKIQKYIQQTEGQIDRFTIADRYIAKQEGRQAGRQTDKKTDRLRNIYQYCTVLFFCTEIQYFILYYTGGTLGPRYSHFYTQSVFNCLFVRCVKIRAKLYKIK